MAHPLSALAYVSCCCCSCVCPPIQLSSLPFFPFGSLIHPLKRLINTPPCPKLESAAGGGEENEEGEEGGVSLLHPSFSLPPWKQHPSSVCGSSFHHCLCTSHAAALQCSPSTRIPCSPQTDLASEDKKNQTKKKPCSSFCSCTFFLSVSLSFSQCLSIPPPPSTLPSSPSPAATSLPQQGFAVASSQCHNTVFKATPASLVPRTMERHEDDGGGFSVERGGVGEGEAEGGGRPGMKCDKGCELDSNLHCRV